MTGFRVNLASRPLRNRRPYLFTAGGLALGALVALVLGIVVFSRSALKLRSVRAALDRLAQASRAAEKEKTTADARVRQATERDQAGIDFANAVILEKTFSWAAFLTRLEKGLPGSSYILSLAPVALESHRVQFRLKVASPGLDDQLELINKLLELDFSQIRVEAEEIDAGGLLTSELLVSYERHI